MNGTKIGNKIYRPLMAQVYHNADEIEEIKAKDIMTADEIEEIKTKIEGLAEKAVANIEITKIVPAAGGIFVRFEVTYTDGTSETKDISLSNKYQHSIRATFQDTNGTTTLVFSFENYYDAPYSDALLLFAELTSHKSVLPVILTSPSHNYSAGFGNMSTSANVTLYGYFTSGSPGPIEYNNLQNKMYLDIQDTVTSV